jgi:DNA-binding MarR family transcriptional regulator
MTADAMPAMPTHYRATQIAYAQIIAQVQELIIGTRLTPQMALALAFIGDQIITPIDIKRYGYFIGTNMSYGLNQLESDGLIERVDQCVSADRRRRPVKLTAAGRRIAIALRSNLAAANRAIAS